MTACIRTGLKTIEQQEKLLRVIQHKAKEVHQMVNCHEKAVEEDVLDFLVMLQSYKGKEL